MPAVPTWEGGAWNLCPSLLQPLATVVEGLLTGHVIDQTQGIGTLPLRERDSMSTSVTVKRTSRRGGKLGLPRAGTSVEGNEKL